MAKQRFFVTGTDTDAGKTFASCALLYRARSQGLSTAAVKPVAAGCEDLGEGLRNGDALALIEAMSLELDYDQVNPICLEPPIAPHIAAAEAGRVLSADRLAGLCRGVLVQGADLTLIEGAGGWRVPLNGRETLADLARALQLPVILVVGLKLGCINHALLTVEAIRADGLHLAGWIANQPQAEPMSRQAENLETLRQLISAPCLGVLPYLPEGPAAAAAYLEWPQRD